MEYLLFYVGDNEKLEELARVVDPTAEPPQSYFYTQIIDTIIGDYKHHSKGPSVPFQNQDGEERELAFFCFDKDKEGHKSIEPGEPSWNSSRKRILDVYVRDPSSGKYREGNTIGVIRERLWYLHKGYGKGGVLDDEYKPVAEDGKVVSGGLNLKMVGFDRESPEFKALVDYLISQLGVEPSEMRRDQNSHW
jgi:hypothetical protein